MTTSLSSIKIKQNVPLAPLTSFGLGGRARYYLRVSSSQEFAQAVALARQLKIPHLIFAGGSNVVFSDQDYECLVIHYLDASKPVLRETGSGVVLEASAGLALASLIKSSINHSLAGLEALSGIPGTVGGAIVGNAGAYGQSISDKITEVEIFDGKRVRWIKRVACKFAYRDSVFKDKNSPAGEWLVLRVRFALEKGDKKKLAQKSREIIRIRNERYKPGLKCPGSYFKNVLVKNVSQKALSKIDKVKIIDGKIPTGYLLESVGARGMREADIEVASFHGNLLFNNGKGKTKDVKILAEKLKKLVWRKFGIKLEEEVRYI